MIGVRHAVAVTLLVVGCGDDGTGDSSTVGATTMPSTTSPGSGDDDVTSTGGGPTSGGSASGSGDGGSDTSAMEPCGDTRTCGAGEVCVQEVFEPPCTIYDPKMGETCPPDQTATNCGGAGVPCCCGEAPPAVFSCQASPGCPAEPTCDCITCPGDKICTPQASGPLLCEPPPQA